MTQTKRRLQDTVMMALFVALLFVGKEVIAFLPNVEIVTLLLLLLAEKYGFKALLPTYAFVLLQIFVYPTGMWVFNYLYVWALWVLLVIALRRFSHPLMWAIAAGTFGLFFGTLCSVPYFITGGIAGGIANILGGLSFDIPHAVSNAVLVGLLYSPLRNVMDKIPQ